MWKARDTPPGRPCQAGLRALGVEFPLHRERVSLPRTLVAAGWLPVATSPSLDEDVSSVTELPPLLTLQRAVLRVLGASACGSGLSGTTFR